MAGRVPGMHGRWPCKRLTVAAQQCLYQTLGLPRTASKTDVKHAYRRLARIYHPDVNPLGSSQEHFQAISYAYEVLSDDAQRLAYDAIGLAALGQQQGQSSGRRRGAGGPERGDDVHAVVAITLREVALGAERLVDVAVLAGCGECGGSGAARGTQVHPCELCRGMGEILKSQRVNSYGMRLRTQSTCPGCGGRGARLSESCRSCAGHGLARQRRSLRVRIPPGVDEGSVLRLQGRGDEGRGGGPAGDVRLRFRLDQCDSMRREGMDVHSQLSLPLWDAILGGPAAVETLRGSTTIQVPAGTQHGTTLSLAQQGLPRLGGPAAATGSHHFKVCITLPHADTLGEAEMELVARLAQLQREQGEWPVREGSRDGVRGSGAQAVPGPLQRAQQARRVRNSSGSTGRQSELPWQQHQERGQPEAGAVPQQAAQQAGAQASAQHEDPPGQQRAQRGRPKAQTVPRPQQQAPVVPVESCEDEVRDGEWLVNLVMELREALDGPEEYKD